ncbi:MAG: LLM class F420-dependent oxidoreductase [Actinobacteria bacterium]|nr:LLM class F420-dependent oxidoreductase [Actinomycetota bacterium]
MNAEASVQVAVQVWPQHSTFAAQRSTWLRCEELGVDDVFTWDHFFPLSGDPDGPHFEGWTLLAAMAEATERVRVGTLVTSVGYRNPDLLADMVATVDHVSDGRAILGLGAGWNERDHREYGFDYGDVSSRAQWFSEAVPRIVERLDRLVPPPVSSPLPILIGGGGERTTLRLVAEHAHIWNFFFKDAAAFRAKDEVLSRWCAQVGREPDEITRSIAINDRSQLDQLDELHAAGLTHVILGMQPADFDEAAVRRLVEWRDRIRG